MGLDWRPMGKPKPGHEDRFNQLFRLISGKEKVKVSFLDKVMGRGAPKKEDMLKEWFDIQIPSYETIGAPRVGRDAAADEWLKAHYQRCLESGQTAAFEEFSKEYQGYYVIELAPESDGIPVYISMTGDANVFRGQFLKDCEDLMGEALLNEAWETKLADDSLIYGRKLLSVADRIAQANGLEYLKDQRTPPEFDEDSLESKVHILYSAGKWLIFYATHGHGYEADF